MSHSSLIMILYTLFYSIMSYGIIFGGNHLIVSKALNCKKKQLKLQQEVETRTHVEIYLNVWEACHLNYSTFLFNSCVCGEEQGSFCSKLWQS
jgi:hypothetical protein